MISVCSDRRERHGRDVLLDVHRIGDDRVVNEIRDFAQRVVVTHAECPGPVRDAIALFQPAQQLHLFDRIDAKLRFEPGIFGEYIDRVVRTLRKYRNDLLIEDFARNDISRCRDCT